MTAVENLVALYGAILATILAYIQYRRWHKSTEIISASPIGEFGKVGDHLGEALSVPMPSVDDAINKMLALATP